MQSQILCAILVVACVAASASATAARFDNYQVFSVGVDTDQHFEVVQQLEADSDFTLWNGVRVGQTSDVMVAPHRARDFESTMERLGLSSSLKVPNVQALIDAEQSPAVFQQQQQTIFNWTTYNTLDEINAWLDAQVAANPTILTNIVIGQSYENRTIRALKLSHKAGNPAIFIEANIHAREWVTSATATWLLNELLTSQAADVLELVQNVDWYIVPVLNVDGFVYTKEHNRMWRKTRQPHSLFCHGADPNRNFDAFWRQYNGASANPCSDSYAGPKAASEPEIVAFSNFYRTIASSVKLYISFHSYGQYIMSPFGHTSELPANYADLLSVMEKGRDAIAVRDGRQYTVGSISRVMYPASGSSIDFTYGIEGLALAYAFEFRDRSNGPYGFMLPAVEIIPNALESFDGIKAMVAEARALRYL